MARRKVIHVDFQTGERISRKRAVTNRDVMRDLDTRVDQYLRQFDLTASWALRIVALLAVLVLMLLMIP